jgi:hypothetical protein
VAESWRDSFLFAMLVLGIVLLFVAPPAGALTLAFTGLCALTTRRTEAVIHAAPDVIESGGGCALGALVLVGLLLMFVIAVQGLY